MLNWGKYPTIAIGTLVRRRRRYYCQVAFGDSVEDRPNKKGFLLRYPTLALLTRPSSSTPKKGFLLRYPPLALFTRPSSSTPRSIRLRCEHRYGAAKRYRNPSLTAESPLNDGLHRQSQANTPVHLGAKTLDVIWTQILLECKIAETGVTRQCGDLLPCAACPS